MMTENLENDTEQQGGCACGDNAPTLLDADGESVMVFGLTAVLTRLSNEGLEPGSAGFDQAVLKALRDTKNRVPKEQQNACLAAISRIFHDYLRAVREQSDHTQGEQP